MNSEEERIKELIFALRRDFKISKDVVIALSKIGSAVIPHLIDAYHVDDFAFRLKIIETLSELGELGLPGLVELLDHSDIKTKTTILKTIRKMDVDASSLNNSIIKKMEEITEWKNIVYTNFQNLEDQVDDIIQFRDILVKNLLEINQLDTNTDTVKELAFITTHIYFRKIQNPEVKTELDYLYTKLLENKKITILEFEELYKKIYKIDTLMEKVIRGYLESYNTQIKSETLDVILEIVGEKLARGLIYKNCDRNFYVYNYDSEKVRNLPNHALYLGMVYLFTDEQLDRLTGITTFDSIKGIVTEMKRDLSYDLEEIMLKDIIGEKGANETIKAGIKKLDLSVKKLSSVDLDPLGDCRDLEFLNLSDNKLVTINLEPLMNCENFDFLDLSKNQLTYLDLKPLSNCKKLSWLVLDNNKIYMIDLTPLLNNTNLLELKLKNNALTTLNLDSLKNCTQLIELDLSNNNIKQIDVTPLESCKQLEFLGIDDSMKLLWRKPNLPKEEDMSEGLREHYSRLIIIK
ncbi:MAG: hypothetical protein ACTSPM_05810 [Candidatus Heimdallarchaeota archaeon]